MYDRISTYFKAEWKILVWITVSGLIYNLGLLAGPWFEGKMAGCLIDILGGSKVFSAMSENTFDPPKMSDRYLRRIEGIF